MQVWKLICQSTITRYILGDLWLSLRYRPPVTISDTACTFTSNLCKMNFQWPLSYIQFWLISVIREPERSVIWFQDKKGCFEVPKLGKNPEVKSVPVLEVRLILFLLVFSSTWRLILWFLVLYQVRLCPPHTQTKFEHKISERINYNLLIRGYVIMEFQWSCSSDIFSSPHLNY